MSCCNSKATKVEPLMDGKDVQKTTKTDILLDIESATAMMMEPGITTISFFKGDKPKHLRQRVMEVCKANPWLVGTLCRDKNIHKKNALLVSPTDVTDEDIKKVYFERLLPVSEEMPFNELSTVITKEAQVDSGNKCIKQSLPISKFTLTPCTTDGFALIVSISHSVVDGHSYYKVLSMLSKNVDIEALDAKRKPDMNDKGKKAVGEKEYAYLFSGAMLMNVVGSMLKGPLSVVSGFYIDQDKVADIKSKEDARLAKGGASTGAFSCSTNDILTSTFGHATKTRVLLMAINWRGRLDGLKNSDAGNYESSLLFDPESFEFPSQIRKTIRSGPPFIRDSNRDVPKGFEAMRCRLGMITSWVFSSFDGDMKLGGEGDSDDANALSLHLPIFRTKGLPFALAVTFRASKDKIAVIYASPTKVMTVDDLKKAGAPLGKELNPSMFQLYN